MCLCCDILTICRCESPTDPEGNRDVYRFFMIGSGAVGKTTVVRQLKCLCQERSKYYKAYDSDWKEISKDDIFSEEEMMQFRKVIRDNITSAVYSLIKQAEQWGNPCQAAESAAKIVRIVEAKKSQGFSQFNMFVDSGISTDLIEVLRDPNIQYTLADHDRMDQRKWHIEDGTLRFLQEDQVTRIFDDGQQLTTSDIVHSRYPTTGIQDFRFSISSMNIQIHDMGGQPTELTKFPKFIQQWVAQDRDGYRNYVLFVTSMSDFNVPDDEGTEAQEAHHENSQNEHTKLERSIRILELLLREAPIQDCGLLIFFNKQDRFDEIVATLQRTENGRREIEKALGDVMSQSDKAKLISGDCPIEVLHDALVKKYDVVIKKRRGKSSDRGVYMRFTQAVDPDIMSDIFKVVKHQIMSDFIKNGAFLAL